MARYGISANGVDQYASLQHAGMDIAADADFSIGVIIQITEKASGDFYYLLSTGVISNGNFNGWYRDKDNNNARTLGYTLQSSSTVADTTALPEIESEPCLLVFTRENGQLYTWFVSSTRTLKLTGTSGTQGSAFSGILWNIMRRGDGNPERYGMGIFSRIFNHTRALTRSEVESILHDELSPAELTGCAINFEFDEGTGTELTDTVSGATMTLHNMPVDDSHWVLLRADAPVIQLSSYSEPEEYGTLSLATTGAVALSAYVESEVYGNLLARREGIIALASFSESDLYGTLSLATTGAVTLPAYVEPEVYGNLLARREGIIALASFSESDLYGTLLLATTGAVALSAYIEPEVYGNLLAYSDGLIELVSFTESDSFGALSLTSIEVISLTAYSEPDTFGDLAADIAIPAFTRLLKLYSFTEIDVFPPLTLRALGSMEPIMTPTTFFVQAVDITKTGAKWSQTHDPVSIEYYPVDFSKWLSDETLVNASFVAPPESQLVVEGPEIDGSIAFVKISGGAVGTFSINVTGESSLGRRTNRQVKIDVKDV